MFGNLIIEKRVRLSVDDIAVDVIQYHPKLINGSNESDPYEQRIKMLHIIDHYCFITDGRGEKRKPALVVETPVFCTKHPGDSINRFQEFRLCRRYRPIFLHTVVEKFRSRLDVIGCQMRVFPFQMEVLNEFLEAISKLMRKRQSRDSPCIETHGVLLVEIVEKVFVQPSVVLS